jgi:hypothetical protein
MPTDIAPTASGAMTVGAAARTATRRDGNKGQGEIERLRSTCAVDGGRLNPLVQVGSPRGIWEMAGDAANDTVSGSRLAPEVGARGMVIGSTFWPACSSNTAETEPARKIAAAV